MRQSTGIRPKTRKLTIPKLSRIELIAFLISLIILSDLSTMQSRLTFKGHKALARILLFSNTFDIHTYIHTNFIYSR